MFVGTFSLALVTAIMRGFEQETYKKLKNITPDLIISAPANAPLEAEALTEYLYTHHGPTIKSIAPYTMQPIALELPTDDSQMLVGFLKVIDPIKEDAMQTLQHKTNPDQNLSELLSDTTIILGKGIAEELAVGTGAIITMVYNSESNASFPHGKPNKKQVTVGALLNTGIAETDNHLVLCSFNCYQTLVTNPQITHLGINATANPSTLKKNLESLEGLLVSSWKDDYPALVSALKLERYAMIFLLSLITLVASMNLLSLIFMVTAYKKTDCALLLSLGLTKKELMAVFMLFSSIIALTSSLIGIGTAYLVALLMKAYPCLSLPDIYYVTHLPVDPYWVEFLLVLVGAFIMSSIAALGALKNIKEVSLTHIFRFE